MGAFRPASVAIALAQGSNTDPADMIALLSEVYPGGIPTRAEAEALIAFDLSLGHATPAWTEFFTNSIADHVLNRYPPRGELNEEKALWLIIALARGGRVAGERGFAALMRTMEAAQDVPPVLAAFALEQVRDAIVAGEGAALGSRPHLGRMVDAEDVVLIARILEAAGGEAGHPLSRAEAEVLFDLHDATAGAANDGSFDDLFFKAIANHLIATAGHRVAPRREMLAPDPRLAELRRVFGGLREQGEAGFRLPHGCAESTELRQEEAAWLASRIMRDGRPTLAEYALLRLFANTGAEGGASLQRFLVNAA